MSTFSFVYAQLYVQFVPAICSQLFLYSKVPKVKKNSRVLENSGKPYSLIKRGDDGEEVIVQRVLGTYPGRKTA